MTDTLTSEKLRGLRADKAGETAENLRHSQRLDRVTFEKRELTGVLLKRTRYSLKVGPETRVLWWNECGYLRALSELGGGRSVVQRRAVGGSEAGEYRRPTQRLEKATFERRALTGVLLKRTGRSTVKRELGGETSLEYPHALSELWGERSVVERR